VGDPVEHDRILRRRPGHDGGEVEHPDPAGARRSDEPPPGRIELGGELRVWDREAVDLPALDEVVQIDA